MNNEIKKSIISIFIVFGLWSAIVSEIINEFGYNNWFFFIAMSIPIISGIITLIITNKEIKSSPKTKQTNPENFDEGDTICASDVYEQTSGEKE